MRAVVKWLVVALVTVHGLIHLVGVADGFDRAAIAWVLAAVLVLAAALAMAVGMRHWWAAALTAAVASQAVILTSWTDAKAGTLANVVLLLAAGYGYAAYGPRSFRADFSRRVEEIEAEPIPTDGDVTESDLAHLPGPVADYVRQSGAVGRPHVHGFRAAIHGRIRGGPTKPWMPFTGEQVNTYGDRWRRLFLLDATMAGLPVDVLHVYDDRGASMRVRAGSVVPMVDASGPDMDHAETVTLFNDLCVLAPAALVDAPVVWEEVDDHHVRGRFTNGTQTVAAELAFDDDHRLVDFVSDDRLRASPDGRTFVPQRWSTPVRDYRDYGPRRIGGTGEARWHAPDPEGEFGYIELVVDELVCQ